VITWKDAFKIGVIVGVVVGISVAVVMGLFGWYAGKKIEEIRAIGTLGKPIPNVTCVTGSHYLVQIRVPREDPFARFFLSQLREATFSLDGAKVNCQELSQGEPNGFACKISESTTKGWHSLVIATKYFGRVILGVKCP